MQQGGSEPDFMPNQTFHLFQTKIKYSVTFIGFDTTFRVRETVICIWKESNIFFLFLLDLVFIFPLSSPTAHSEKYGFGWTPLPQEKTTQGIPQKKNCKKQEGQDKTLYINFISLFPIILKS